MGGRRTVLQEVGPLALDFLVHDHEFEGPEFGTPSVGQGERLTYRRQDLTVTLETWSWKNESGFDTNLTLTPADGENVSAALHSIYEACGLGTAQDVPAGNSGGGHTTRKRIDQHSAALRAVIPLLNHADAAEIIRRAPARQ